MVYAIAILTLLLHGVNSVLQRSIPISRHLKFARSGRFSQVQSHIQKVCLSVDSEVRIVSNQPIHLRMSCSYSSNMLLQIHVLCCVSICGLALQSADPRSAGDNLWVSTSVLCAQRTILIRHCSSLVAAFK